VRVVVEDRALADDVAAFPADRSAVRVSWVGSDAANLDALDPEARRVILRSHGPVDARARLRMTRLGGESVRLQRSTMSVPEHVL
jgi:hypothetical protein